MSVSTGHDHARTDDKLYVIMLRSRRSSGAHPAASTGSDSIMSVYRSVYSAASRSVRQASPRRSTENAVPPLLNQNRDQNSKSQAQYDMYQPTGLDFLIFDFDFDFDEPTHVLERTATGARARRPRTARPRRR